MKPAGKPKGTATNHEDSSRPMALADIKVQPLVTTKWTSTFQSKTKQLVDATTNAQEVEALEQLLSFLSADCFSFANRTAAATRIQAQDGLLDIWVKLLDNVDRVFYTNREMYYDVIYRIMVRYEFDLNNYVGVVNVGDSASKQKNLFPQLLCSPEQERILFKYKECLIRTVEYVIKKFEKPFSTFVQKRFALQTFVVVYFRIPVLSGALLDSICPTNPDVPYITPHTSEQPKRSLDPYDAPPPDKDDDEFKDTATPVAMQRAEHSVQLVREFVRKEREETLVNDKRSKSFFDCNHSFFQWTWVATPEKDVELMQQVSALKNRFLDPSEEYNFLFVSMLVNFVIQQAHGEILWMLIPGFSNMMESVICATAKRGLPDYSLLVERSLQDLSRVPGALNIVTEVVIKSTHGNSPGQINLLLNLLDNFLMKSSVPENNLAAPLPKTFDPEVLLDALDQILEGEHFQVLSKAIWFLYRNSNRFDLRTRKKVVGDLVLQKFFTKLFLHWCTEVRQFFHYFLLFRVSRLGIAKLEKGSLVVNSLELENSPPRGLFSKLLMGQSESKTSASSKQKKKQSHADWPIVPFGMEPTPDTCMLVSCSLTEDEVAQDESLKSTIESYISLIRQQLHGTTKQRCFPPNLTAYAKASLKEYEDTEKIFFKTQTEFSSGLKLGQTLVPNFAYEVRPNVGPG